LRKTLPNEKAASKMLVKLPTWGQALSALHFLGTQTALKSSVKTKEFFQFK